MAEENNTAQVDMFEELKKHIMWLYNGDGDADDFNEFVEINRLIEGIRIRLNDRDTDVIYYRREACKNRLEVKDLKEQIEKLQKEKEELEGRLDTALFHLEDRTVN